MCRRRDDRDRGLPRERPPGLVVSVCNSTVALRGCERVGRRPSKQSLHYEKEQGGFFGNVVLLRVILTLDCLDVLGFEGAPRNPGVASRSGSAGNIFSVRIAT